MSAVWARGLAALAMVATAACGPDTEGSQSSDTDAADGTSSGDVEEAGLQVAYLRGSDLLGTRVYLVDTCVGDGCPAPVTELRTPDDPPTQPSGTVVACDPAAPLEGLPEGYACALSAAWPLIEFDVVTPLRRDSFELSRPSLNPTAGSETEGFWSRSDVVRVVGPKTTYAGTYASSQSGAGSGEWDTFDMVSVTCTEALGAEGVSYSDDELPELCTEERRIVTDGVFASAQALLDRECASGRSDPESPVLTCACEDADAACAEVVLRECVAPWGDADDTYGGGEGDFAYGVMRRRGGPSLDERTRLVKLRLDMFGAQSASETGEGCSNYDGGDWPGFAGNHDGAFDHAMCSDSVYRVEFATSEAPDHIAGEDGEVFDGGSTFEFRTAPFVIVPGSLFPTDNLVIGQSDDMSVRFSAVPNFGAANLRGVTITRGSDGPVVAGGADCDPEADEDAVLAGDAIPCLDFDPENIQVGQISFRIDVEQYGRPLEVGERYFVHFPDASSDAPFIDVCGHPLRSDAPTVLGWTIDSLG